MKNLESLTKADLIKLLQAQPTSDDLQVRLTSNTNLYIRTAKMQAWSEKKSKYYTYGLNINYEAAKVLFNDSELLESIKERINSL